MPETSVLIRTKNEQKWVGECLRRLFSQSYRDFEVLVLDSGSTDRTLEIVKQFPVRLSQIKSAEFTYPLALNRLCRQAKAAKYFCILSAHSLPSSRTWLQDGIESFLNDRVCGVYGPVWALPDGSIWEKLLFNHYLNVLRHRFRRRKIIYKTGLGVLGNTNVIIRRDLWEAHPFDETHVAGGEDGAWAAHWLGRGFTAVRDLKFAVRHSHSLGLHGLWKQFQYWRAMRGPNPEPFHDYGRGGR